MAWFDLPIAVTGEDIAASWGNQVREEGMNLENSFNSHSARHHAGASDELDARDLAGVGNLPDHIPTLPVPPATPGSVSSVLIVRRMAQGDTLTLGTLVDGEDIGASTPDAADPSNSLLGEWRVMSKEVTHEIAGLAVRIS